MAGSPDLLAKNDLRTFASEVCADDPEIFGELLGDCRNDIEEQFKNLREARRSGNWRDFNRAAHSIKSAARTFGSPLVKKLALELEEMSDGGAEDEAAVDRKTKELRAACDRFEKELEKIGKNPTGFLS
jgi:HPt (histidine-containing phosphotransfer) domain-containing protein